MRYTNPRTHSLTPATDARRRQPSIDIPRPHGDQQQTRRAPLLLSIDGTDRRTDGPLHRPRSAYDASSGSVLDLYGIMSVRVAVAAVSSVKRPDLLHGAF